MASSFGVGRLTAAHGSPDMSVVFSLILHFPGHHVHTQPDFKSSHEGHWQENRT